MPVHHHPTRSAAELEAMVVRLAELSTARVVLPVEGHEYLLDGD